MKHCFYLLMVLSLMGCQSGDATVKEKLTVSIKKYYEDEAIKQNKNVTFFKIADLQYRLVSENRIDSLRLLSLARRAYYYSDSSKEHSREMSRAVNLMALSKEAGDVQSFDKYSRESQDLMLKVMTGHDSLKRILNEDSIIKKRISRPPGQSTYFDTKFICKSTIGEETHSDTLEMIFNKDFRYVPIE